MITCTSRPIEARSEVVIDYDGGYYTRRQLGFIYKVVRIEALYGVEHAFIMPVRTIKTGKVSSTRTASSNCMWVRIEDLAAIVDEPTPEEIAEAPEDTETVNEEIERKYVSAFERWLDTFVEEKAIDLDDTFVVGSDNGTPNHFSYRVVVETIKSTSPKEQSAIKKVLVKLDFHNASITDYFRHLAQAIAFDL